MKIYCYGDSNTYGFDPRSFFGDRYETDIIWTECLKQLSGCEVVNDGMNGRELPHTDYEYQRLERALLKEQPELFLILLGSNDALDLVPEDDICSRLEKLAVFLKNKFPAVQPVMIAPVTAEVGEAGRDALLSGLDEVFRKTAAAEKLPCAFANDWEIPLCFDAVHYTEEGHRRFAEKLRQFLTGSGLLP